MSGLLRAAGSLEINWVQLGGSGGLDGATPASLDLRARTGATVIAVQREGGLVPNPAPDFCLQAGDYLGLIGESTQLDAAEKLLGEPVSG